MTHCHCQIHGLINLDKPLTESQADCLENCTDQTALDKCPCGNLVEEGKLINGECAICVSEGKAIAKTEAILWGWR